MHHCMPTLRVQLVFAMRFVMIMYCLQQGAECLTFLYTPNNDTAVNSIIAAMRSNNSPAIPDSRTKGFGSTSEVTNTPHS